MPDRGLPAIDWSLAGSLLDRQGFAPIGPLLSAEECAGLAAMYGEDRRFRSQIEMERFRFGVGEYTYFAAPLPAVVASLRTALYGKLAPIANRWASTLGHRAAFPATLEAFLTRCHSAGQTRPTPLLLSYQTGGYNCLHQDIYGDIAFPLQVVIGLSRPDTDYTGGEFLLVEQRPRAQSRGHAIRIEQGSGVAFATRERPIAGARGPYRVVMRHGVSTVASGARMTLGVIFHDAK
jgi:hypothetical protein